MFLLVWLMVESGLESNFFLFLVFARGVFFFSFRFFVSFFFVSFSFSFIHHELINGRNQLNKQTNLNFQCKTNIHL